MRFLLSIFFLVSTLLCCACQKNQQPGEKLRIAVAANFSPCLSKIVQQTISNKDYTIELIPGASGNLYAQIRAGAPFDLFFSADLYYPQALAKDNIIAHPPKVYALGQLVLWAKDKSLLKRSSLQTLQSPAVKKIALAHPQHAPYGKKAKEVLHKLDLWEKLQDKLVMGKNILQVAHFAQTHNVELAFLSRSVALLPELQQKGSFIEIPEKYYSPLKQGLAILRPEKRVVKKFLEDFYSSRSQEMIRESGYILIQ